MKVGDLVRYCDGGWIGVVIREIPGTAGYKIVMWNNDMNPQSVERKYLRVVSA